MKTTLTFPTCEWSIEKKIEHAIVIGNFIADETFGNLNGHSKFPWKEFPEMVKKIADSQAFFHFPGICENDIYERVAQAAFDRAKKLVKKRNLI